MIKTIVFLTIVATTLAGFIEHQYEQEQFEDRHDHGHEEIPVETEHHHDVEHKHATSHQSFKFHHFHPVPVYIKKEDQQFLKHPIEISGIKHKLKIVHPETKHNHGHGLTLENHSEVSDKHAEYDSGSHYGGVEFGGHEKYHDINIHHGGDES